MQFKNPDFFLFSIKKGSKLPPGGVSVLLVATGLDDG